MKKYIFFMFLLTFSIPCYSIDYDRILGSYTDSQGAYNLFIANERDYIQSSEKRWLYSNPEKLYEKFVSLIRNNNSLEDTFSPTIVLNIAETEAFWVHSNKDLANILMNNKNPDILVSPLYRNGQGYRFFISGLKIRKEIDDWYKNLKSMFIHIDYIPNSDIEGVEKRFEISLIYLMDFEFEYEYLEYFPEDDGVITKNRQDVYGTLLE